MGAIASQITGLTIVYSTDYSDAEQRKHQSSTSLAFVWGIHTGSRKLIASHTGGHKHNHNKINATIAWCMELRHFLFLWISTLLIRDNISCPLNDGDDNF